VTAHIHDNHGIKDEHLPPFGADIEWDAALTALTRVQSPLVLELKEQPAYAEPAPPSLAIEATRAAFDRLESALDSAASRGA
jgi:sugar phosphate isomerase/epimerase